MGRSGSMLHHMEPSSSIQLQIYDCQISAIWLTVESFNELVMDPALAGMIRLPKKKMDFTIYRNQRII